ncbi:uncharacterized protein [Argopecten irradians]|uniref:uncharacterized protein isoform X3 n=1 Tax=Argopecten irradians TaxID=31199 RepID=UPI00371B6AB5
MKKVVFLLFVVAVVVASQAQTQSVRPARLLPPSRRVNGRGGRQSPGAVLLKPASATTNTPAGAKPKPRLGAGPATKARSLIKVAPSTAAAKVTTKAPTPGSPKTKCKGRCKFPEEVCVRKARCAGPQCFFCAEANSIPKVSVPKSTPSPMNNMNSGFDTMMMDNMGMLGMQQQQQPTDIFSDIFGLGPSTGGFDLFGTSSQQSIRQPASPRFTNSFYSRNPLTSIPVAGESLFNPLDFSQPFGGLFGGSGSGSGGMNNLLSMSMLGIDPFQLF